MAALLLPTTVVGSHAYPSWFWTALEAIKQGQYGITDTRETFNDGVHIAIFDQERAGVDIITDGEMRRWYFVQSFYQRMQGLERQPDLRKVGVYGYDMPPRYRPVERITVPEGLGIVEEFQYARQVTRKPLKVTCPGPLTLGIHIQLHDTTVYKDRLELSWEFVPVINRELKALVAAGADFIQIDEPSYAIIPGSARDYLELFNAAVEGVQAKIALHICFGNLASRPRGPRRYAPLFPAFHEARADQFVFEFANREMKEIERVKAFCGDRELGLGVVDVKSFYVEPAEEIAARIREALQYIEPEKVYINPDCGFFQLPRWLAVLKLQRMVAAAQLVRRELAG
ncbi:MAG: methionine synthase [Candidatus Tectimicrobiota bacterium]|nr:MAG: methionine synthase [Candidatus Tectomicrobia bacterium]